MPGSRCRQDCLPATGMGAPFWHRAAAPGLQTLPSLGQRDVSNPEPLISAKEIQWHGRTAGPSRSYSGPSSNTLSPMQTTVGLWSPHNTAAPKAQPLTSSDMPQGAAAVHTTACTGKAGRAAPTLPPLPPLGHCESPGKISPPQFSPHPHCWRVTQCAPAGTCCHFHTLNDV